MTCKKESEMFELGEASAHLLQTVKLRQNQMQAVLRRRPVSVAQAVVGAAFEFEDPKPSLTQLCQVYKRG